MKISSIPNTTSSLSRKNTNTQNNKLLSFKSLYIEDDANIGDVSETRSHPPVFRENEFHWLNQIACEYPNQDCFIKRGESNYPYLEFRERPKAIQTFSVKYGNRYVSEIDPTDSEYLSVPLILEPGSKFNRFLGLPSTTTISSLPSTVRAGYELHKKMLQEKKDIFFKTGENDFMDLGEQGSVIEAATAQIEKYKYAVTRYLLELVLYELSNPEAAKADYDQIIPDKVAKLELARQDDLVRSTAKQSQNETGDSIDICDVAMELCEEIEENKKRIEDIEASLLRNEFFIE